MGGFVGGIESKGRKNSVCVSQFGKLFSFKNVEV